MPDQKSSTRKKTGPRIRPVPAVSRAIAILRLLGRTPEPLGVKAIATELSLVPSTCLHILRVLVAESLIQVDSNKRYSLATGMLSLARSVIQRNSFATHVQPVLDRLARDWSVTTIGVQILDREHMIAVAISRSPIPFGIRVEVGSRFPSLLSATGRLYAAFGGLEEAELDAGFKSLEWDRPMSYSSWKQEVARARASGYAVDRDRYINGITVVAVPLLNSAGQMTNSVVGAGLSEQLSPERLDGMAEDMMHEAGRLSQESLS